MADWSSEHNTYLSALLDDVTGSEEGVRIRQVFCEIYDGILSINPDNVNWYFTGSKAEGLDLPGSDEDYMFDINGPSDIEVSESLQDLVQSTRRNKLLIVTDNVPPAFAMLKCVTLSDQHLLRSALNLGADVYLSSEQFMSLSHWLNPNADRQRIQGPSIEAWDEYDDIYESGDDNVPSILCKFWPTSAAEWKDRPRKFGWPTQHDREYIQQFGCHIVPVGHPLSARKSLEWRLSFSIAERTLVWSFNHTQLQCYAVMKLILKEYVKTKCTEKHKSVLCSYFIKTFLFWQFEKIELSFWQITNLTECILYLFQEFYSCIQTGVLRHFFVSCFNLLEIKLTPDAQRELLKIFGKVIEAGISIIGQSSSFSRVFSNFIAITDRRHCEMRTKDIHKRRIFDNDRIIMYFLENFISYLIEKQSRSDDSLHAAFFRLSNGRTSASLAMFAIKHLCRFTVKRALYKTSYQSNKYLHFLMKSLRENIYGTDLASSKLWLVTFWLQQGNYYESLQNVNQVLSSIPPYALYDSGTGIKSKSLYVDRYCRRNVDILCRAKEAWLFDMYITHSEYSLVPRAIQIELDYCNPSVGVSISPFTYAYYLMFLCYHGLGQYDNRNRALRQLVDTANDDERCGLRRHYSYNIAGHCLLIAGYVEMARDMFLESARFTQQNPVLDQYNAVYRYLSFM